MVDGESGGRPAPVPLRSVDRRHPGHLARDRVRALLLLEVVEVTIQATRALLLSNLVRSSDRKRVVRLLGRLSGSDLSLLLLQIDGIGLRRAAQVLLEGERVHESLARLSPEAQRRLLHHAPDVDARRALLMMRPRAAAVELMALPYTRRHVLLAGMEGPPRDRLIGLLPRRARPPRAGQDGIGAVLRLRRILA